MNLPHEVKKFFDWLFTLVIIIALFIACNFFFTEVLDFEGLGTLTAILMTWAIVGAYTK